MTIRIRPATEKDIAFILKGNDIIDQLSVHKSKRGLTADYLREDIFSDKPAAYIDVAVTDRDEPVAFVLYSFFYLASAGQAVWISKVYLDPFSRKINIGPLLRNYLFDRYPHIPGLYGSVATNNKNARMFFTSLGGESLNNEFVYYMLKRPE